jgi:fibro-slime domain-containing protein
MKSILATLKNSKGIVMLVAIMILLAVFAIGLSMVVSAGMSSTIAKNYKNKLLSFYASDGQMTVLAQAAVDSTYWHWLSASATTNYKIRANRDSKYIVLNSQLLDATGADSAHGATFQKVASGSHSKLKEVSTGMFVAFNGTQQLIANADLAGAMEFDFPACEHTVGDGGVGIRAVNDPDADKFSAAETILKSRTNSCNTTDANAWERYFFVGVPSSVDTGAGTVSYSKYKVAWYLKVLGSNKVNLQTRAYDSLTKWGVVFETPLKQYIERQGGVYVNPYGDTALVPVTFYDFRSNRTNPEFEQPNDGWRSKRMVQDTLDTERKPILGSNMHLNRYIQKWFRPWLPGDSTIPIYQNTTLSYNTKNHSYLSRWKIPHLGTDGYQGCTPFTGKVDSSWGFCYCGGSCGNNCSTWGEYCSNCSTGVFIDTCLNRWDSAFYNVVIKDTLKFHLKDQATGTYEFATDSFFRLDNKGLGKEWNWWKGLDHNGCSPAPCYDDHNYSFTMEIKRTFTKVPNLKFNFTGDDDVWLFLNNRLAMDIGGCHQKVSDSAIVDNITPALTNGTVYNFDFFYCERHSANSDIKITTNMLVYKPVTTKQRHWKREYGRLD